MGRVSNAIVHFCNGWRLLAVSLAHFCFCMEWYYECNTSLGENFHLRLGQQVILHCPCVFWGGLSGCLYRFQRLGQYCKVLKGTMEHQKMRCATLFCAFGSVHARLRALKALPCFRLWPCFVWLLCLPFVRICFLGGSG